MLPIDFVLHSFYNKAMKRERRNLIANFRVTPSEKKDIQKAADRREIIFSEFLRLIIFKFLKQDGAKLKVKKWAETYKTSLNWHTQIIWQSRAVYYNQCQKIGKKNL